jgi:PAS domain S-box-containing protein
LSVPPSQTEDRQSLRIKRFLIATASYGLAVVLAGIGAWMDLWSVEVFVTYTIIAVAINAVLYGVFVSGLNQKYADPSLTRSANHRRHRCADVHGVSRRRGTRHCVAVGAADIHLRRVPFENSATVAVSRSNVGCVLRDDLFFIAAPARIQSASRNIPVLTLGSVLVWFTFMGGYVSALRSRTRRSEAFYRTMWDTANDAAMIVDADGRIEYANPAVLPVFGRSPEALTGSEVLPLLAQARARVRGATFLQFLDAYKKQSGDWNRIEMRFVNADGREFPAEVSTAEMHIEDGRRFWFSCMTSPHAKNQKKRWSPRASLPSRRTAPSRSFSPT